MEPLAENAASFSAGRSRRFGRLPQAGPSVGSTSLGPVDGDYTPAEVSQLHADGQVQLIDVRAQHEYESGRIAGARLIELPELPAAAGSIDRERPVVFYCRSGSRSAMATQAFRDAGYDAHNMTGGLLDWHAGGLPLEPGNGYVAEA
jgi:rhodanese-related sulfurtransferase